MNKSSLCLNNVTELVIHMFLSRTTILAIATHICTLLSFDQTTKKSMKCIRFDVLVWIIESLDSLLLLCTISAHLIKHLVQVSPNLVNSVAGISNRFLFVIIEQLPCEWTICTNTIRVLNHTCTELSVARATLVFILIGKLSPMFQTKSKENKLRKQ